MAISDLERSERRARVDGAIASVRLEGLEPTEAAMAVFERYVSGELTLDEMSAEIQRLNAQKISPARGE